MTQTIAVEWNSGQPRGTIEITDGHLSKLTIADGSGRVTGARFALTGPGPHRLLVPVRAGQTQPGIGATIITVRDGRRPFSFWLRDVTQADPIFIRDLGVLVTTATDRRSFQEVEQALARQALATGLEQIEREPEETFANAAAHTRNMKCETWLGLARDMRLFSIGFRSNDCWCDWIQPRFHGYDVKLPETKDSKLKYQFVLGRGIGCTDGIQRRLEDGVLPILHATHQDDEMHYHLTAFTTLETQPLAARNVRGTHWLVADGHGAGFMFTPDQQARYNALLPIEMAREEETVLCLHVTAVNTAAVPRYAWMYMPAPLAVASGNPRDHIDDRGFAQFDTGRVYAVHHLNGQPLRQREIAVLVPPGASVTFECFLPHRPISKARAAKLARLDFATHHAACREYWLAKLRQGAQLRLPEPRIDEMARAGLLHLDVVAHGLEPNGPLTPNIGWYCPIGSESAPIIQFFDSMGWHKVAERSLQYFLEKQHADGFMQNFNNYMLETGAALWSMGEHWRYTRDRAWVQRITPQLLKSCNYIIQWRERNQRPDLRGRGYGMLDGKVADPDDPFHIFMLNGYAYLGLCRVAEMLATINPRESKRLAAAAAGLRRDIRTAIDVATAVAPVVPLGNGTWVPTCPPWVDKARGLLCLYADNTTVYSHGTFGCRDSLLGPLYLLFSEILAPHEPLADWLVNVHAEFLTTRNVGFSQPFYCRQDWAHVQRGEVKPFLKTYYNGFASLADRSTYTFWEHYGGISPHKTHEEGWFLMQTRWMLWLEAGDTLRLLPAVPRAWLAHGQRIELENVASYFGPITLRVQSRVDQDIIEAEVECDPRRQPRVIDLRLPHPAERRAVAANGGRYLPNREVVRISPFRGRAKVTLRF